MNEWIMIFGMASSGILFASGGTDIPIIGGQKWIRRFILPIALSLIAYYYGISVLRCIMLCGGLIVSLHLGYGSSLPYWRKAITAVALIIPSFFLGFSIWQIITPSAFLSMFWLSNNNVFSKMFPWKVVEFLTGTLIGITIIQLINQTY